MGKYIQLIYLADKPLSIELDCPLKSYVTSAVYVISAVYVNIRTGKCFFYDLGLNAWDGGLNGGYYYKVIRYEGDMDTIRLIMGINNV